MASSWTFAALEAAVKAWVEDDYTDFDTEWPTILNLAEDSVLRALNLVIFDSEPSITITSGNPAVNKPANILYTRELYYVSGNSRVYLEQKSKQYIRDYAPDTTAVGLPLFWAEDTPTAYLLGPTPNFTGSGYANVHIRPNSLNVDTGGTWLSKNAGDVLFAACMKQAELFGMAMAEAKDWNAEFNTALGLARFEFRSLIRNDYAPVPGVPTPRGEK